MVQSMYITENERPLSPKKQNTFECSTEEYFTFTKFNLKSIRISHWPIWENYLSKLFLSCTSIQLQNHCRYIFVGTFIVSVKRLKQWQLHLFLMSDTQSSSKVLNSLCSDRSISNTVRILWLLLLESLRSGCYIQGCITHIITLRWKLLQYSELSILVKQ